MDRQTFQQLYQLSEGALAAVVKRPEVRAAFAAWESKLGVVAKARNSDEDAFQRAIAGEDRWTLGLLSAAYIVLRDDLRLGPRPGEYPRRDGPPLRLRLPDLLALPLVDHYVRLAARLGGRRLDRPTRPLPLPNVNITGVTLTGYETPEHHEAELRRVIREAQDHLDKLKQAVDRHVRGRQPSLEVMRRDGRWLAMAEMDGGKPDEPAKEYHRRKGHKHDAEKAGVDEIAAPGWERDEGDGTFLPCDECLRHVQDRLSRARADLRSEGF